MLYQRSSIRHIPQQHRICISFALLDGEENIHFFFLILMYVFMWCQRMQILIIFLNFYCLSNMTGLIYCLEKLFLILRERNYVFCGSFILRYFYRVSRCRCLLFYNLFMLLKYRFFELLSLKISIFLNLNGIKERAAQKMCSVMSVSI